MADEKTKDELYAEAQELDIEGRSEMNKDELEAAVAKAKGGQADAQKFEAPKDSDFKRGDGSPAVPERPSREEQESGWKRGADLDDAEALAAVNEEVRLAQLGTTGGQAAHPVMATGGAQPADPKEAAQEAKAIREAAAKRNVEKAEKSGPTNTTPTPAQEGAVKEGEPAAQETGSGDAKPAQHAHHAAKKQA